MGSKSILVAITLISCLPICATAAPAEGPSTAGQDQYFQATERTLANGAPVDKLDGGMTLLIAAAAAGRADVVKLLLDHGANPNLHADASMEGATAIHAAAGMGAVDVVSLLIDRGVSVDSTDLLGMTPLSLASIQGKTRVIALLYARGANVNSAPPNGMTPLHYAAGGGHRDAVALLIALGANITAKDSDGRTPYDLAAKSTDLTPNDRAAVLAWLAPANVAASAPPAAQQVHGCPHTAEDLAWFYGRLLQADPETRKHPAEAAMTVDNELKQMGCPGQ